MVRFLGLSPATSNPNTTNKNGNNKTSTPKSVMNTGRPRNSRDCENERKRLKKEIDKLLKAHAKTSKTLDDLRNEHSNDLNPIDDMLLMEKNGASGKDKSQIFVRRPDIQYFPGLPSYSTGDVLMVWDFLCTFSRVLSLEPIGLDDFVAAITFCPQDKTSKLYHEGQCEANIDEIATSIPVYLAEAHLALLKLLLSDPSSDEWWWSTLESDVTRIDDENDLVTSENYSKISEAMTPVIKVDLAELLAVEEDPILTTRWLQALEDVRTRKTNSGGPIKSAVKSAASITTNPIVKTYLQKSMRKWKGNAAGFTKRAVVWLVDRVREARPDLWGKKVSKEAVNEQTSKVAMEVAAVMDLFEEDVEVSNENGSNLEEGSDEDDDSDDDEEDDAEDFLDDDEEIKKNTMVVARRQMQNDETSHVTSAIPVKPPPTIVDLLLPPAKPSFSSDIVSPLTWPCVVGASVCRILHRYKRQRNEVDDELREFHSLPPLSVAERRRRENSAAQRIFSESTASLVAGEGESLLPLEAAIDHLCCGQSYLKLLPIQRICVFRALVEAAYDTHRVTRAIEENFRARINAVKSLDNEEKRAKREAREEAAAADRSARQRLAEDMRQSFLVKKRNEIRRMNKNTNKYDPEFIENLTDEDIIQFDEETKQAYDALPTPESFNKTEVNAMVTKINEESAFESSSVLVLTMDEIKNREEEYLEQLEDRLASYGDIESMYENSNFDRETSAKIDKLQREIENLKLSLIDLPEKRAAAVDTLTDAIEEGTVKELKYAIKTAKLAHLFGMEESTGGVWALDILRDAALELRVAERRRRVTEAQKDLVAKRNKCFIRTYSLGQDRYRNCVWHFDNDSAERVWTEIDFDIFKSDSNNPEEKKDIEDTNTCVNIDNALVGANDEEQDFCTQRSPSSIMEDEFSFCRKEYHPSGMLAGLPRRHWGGHITERSLRSLMKNYDQRGIRESALKARIKEILEAKGQRNVETSELKKPSTDSSHENQPHDDPQRNQKPENPKCQSSGDEESFTLAKQFTESKGYDVSHIGSKSSAIGQRIRVRTIFDSVASTDIAIYEMGTVIGWSKNDQENGINHTSADSTIHNDHSDYPIWRISLDKGGELDLSGFDVVKGLTRAILWTSNHKEYLEIDASFLIYRNNLGRFCGRQTDAAYSASPFFFAKQMIKREAELYTPLKNRSHWNEWGGRSVARNAWLSTMKDVYVDFAAVRDGLLTLETAFFELSGGFMAFNELKDNEHAHEHEAVLDGKELLNNESYRFDIELESITGTPKSLWNSRETRAIFIEIMQCE